MKYARWHYVSCALALLLSAGAAAAKDITLPPSGDNQFFSVQWGGAKLN